MTYRLPTASAIGRVMACPASHILPQVQRTSAAAMRGIEIHRYIANAIQHGKESALVEVSEEHREIYQAFDFDSVDRLMTTDYKIHVEHAIAWDFVTDHARSLGSNIGRNYQLTSNEIAGTADLILEGEGQVTILDWKTGRYVEPAHESWQLRTLAVMASRLFAIGHVRAVIAQLRDDGTWQTDEANFYDLELDGFAVGLMAMAERIRAADGKYNTTGSVNVTEGEHCRFCPAYTYCPAKTRLVHSMRTKLDALSEDRIHAEILSLSSEAAGAAYTQAQEYKRLLALIVTALEERARIEPLPLPTGTMLAETPGRETLDSTIACEVLMRELGADAAIKAVKPTVTKETLKRVANGKMGELMDKIRAAGGVKIGNPILREVKP